MKVLLLLLTILSLMSCSGGEGSKESGTTVVNNYEVFYVYPENPLLPGEGSTEVYAYAVVCKDSLGKIVDDAFCSEIDQVDLASAPVKNYNSPAGLVPVEVPNSDLPEVMVPVQEGVDWGNVDDETRRNTLAPLVSCSTGFILNFRGDCVIQGYSFSYGDWPVNNLTACQGSQVVSRTYLCIDDVTGNSVDYFFCSGTPDITSSYSSPVGNSSTANEHGDVLSVLCQEGKTVGDIGNGSVVSSVISCGNQRHLSSPTDLSCVPNTYYVDGVVFPGNDMTVGTGSRVVMATSFNQCRSSNDNELVDITYCSSIDISTVTDTQLSPSGELFIEVPNAVGGGVYLYMDEGFDFVSLSQADKELMYEPLIICEEGHDKNGATCGGGADTTVKEIAGIGTSLCILSESGKVRCLGANNFGQLGVGSITPPEGMITPLRSHTEELMLPASAVKITSGAGNTFCALLDNGSIYCWGSNQYGLIGLSDMTTPVPIPTLMGNSPVGKKIFSFEMRELSACLILGEEEDEHGEVYCWGDTRKAQLGVTTPSYSSDIYKVEQYGPVKKIAVGDQTCAVMLDGTVKCMDKNPTIGAHAVSGLYDTVDIGVGQQHKCALDSNGTLRCWGKNTQGQAGHGAGAGDPVGVGVVLVNVKSFKVSQNHSCAILENLDVMCWGDFSRGAVGQSEHAFTPTFLTGNAKEIFVGRNFTCVLKMDNEVECVGLNNGGVLGFHSMYGNISQPTVADFFLTEEEVAVLMGSTGE